MLGKGDGSPTRYGCRQCEIRDEGRARGGAAGTGARRPGPGQSAGCAGEAQPEDTGTAGRRWGRRREGLGEGWRWRRAAGGLEASALKPEGRECWQGLPQGCQQAADRGREEPHGPARGGGARP